MKLWPHQTYHNYNNYHIHHQITAAPWCFWMCVLCNFIVGHNSRHGHLKKANHPKLFMYSTFMYVCLPEKPILQSLSQRIINYWKIIHKYVKFTMAVTDQNWKCCSQFVKSLSQEAIFHTADKSLLNYFLREWSMAVITDRHVIQLSCHCVDPKRTP